MKQSDSPKMLSLVDLIQWIANPIGYMEKASQRYGDIFRVQVGWDFSPHVFVSHPQAIQQIFTNELKQFSPFSDSLSNLVKPFVGEHSLLRLENDLHRRQRLLLMPPLHGERMQSYGNQICRITDEVMSRLASNKPFNIHKVMLDISLEVILQAVFGLRQGERSERIKRLLVTWLDTLGSSSSVIFLLLPFLQKDLGTWSPWGYFQSLNRELSQLLYAVIRERREQYDSSRTDILTLLLSVKDEDGVGMTDEELYDELLTLLGVGHETTAAAMTWALYWVHQQSEVRNKLLEELATLGNTPDPMTIFILIFCCELRYTHIRKSPDLRVGSLSHRRQSAKTIACWGLQMDFYPRETSVLEHRRFSLSRYVALYFNSLSGRNIYTWTCYLLQR